MIVIAGFILGLIVGGLLARRRKGRMADVVHYAAIYGLAFALAGLILTVVIERVAS